MTGVQAPDPRRVHEGDAAQHRRRDPHLDTDHRLGHLADGHVPLQVLERARPAHRLAGRHRAGEEDLGLVAVPVRHFQPARRGEIGPDRAEVRPSDERVQQRGLAALRLADDDHANRPGLVDGGQVLEQLDQIVAPDATRLLGEPLPETLDRKRIT
jgi:hypothetical protein